MSRKLAAPPRTFLLERQQWVPRPVEHVFDFFSRAGNLAEVTPAWLGFRILPPAPERIAEGTRIDYAIRLGPVPMRWRTRITVWQPAYRFVDVQERGPYRYWEHTHRFEALGGGTLVTDVVRYAPPFGPLGRATNAMVIRGMLAAIFDHRYRTIANRFPASGPTTAGSGV